MTDLSLATCECGEMCSVARIGSGKALYCRLCCTVKETEAFAPSRRAARICAQCVYRRYQKPRRQQDEVVRIVDCAKRRERAHRRRQQLGASSSWPVIRVADVRRIVNRVRALGVASERPISTQTRLSLVRADPSEPLNLQSNYRLVPLADALTSQLDGQ